MRYTIVVNSAAHLMPCIDTSWHDGLHEGSSKRTYDRAAATAAEAGASIRALSIRLHRAAAAMALCLGDVSISDHATFDDARAIAKRLFVTVPFLWSFKVPDAALMSRLGFPALASEVLADALQRCRGSTTSSAASLTQLEALDWAHWCASGAAKRAHEEAATAAIVELEARVASRGPLATEGFANAVDLFAASDLYRGMGMVASDWRLQMAAAVHLSSFYRLRAVGALRFARPRDRPTVAIYWWVRRVIESDV